MGRHEVDQPRPFLRKSKKGEREYYSIVTNKRDGKRVKTTLIQHLGTIDKMIQMARESKLSINKLEISGILDCGEIESIYHLIQEFGLIDLIDANVVKTPGISPTVGQVAAILACYQALEPGSKKMVPGWYRDTVLPGLMDLPPEKIYPQSIYRAMDYLDEETGNKILQHLFNLVKEKHGIETGRFYYDITSSYFEGNHCPIAFYGYSRDHRNDRPQVVLGLVTVSGGGFPCFYRTWPGNTPDVATTLEIVGELSRAHGASDFTLVMDRGMMSEDVRKALDGKSYQYMSALRCSTDLSKQLIRETENATPVTFKSASGHELRLVGFDREIDGRPLRCVVVHSLSWQEEEDGSLEEKIVEAREALDVLQQGLKKRSKKFELLQGKIKKILHGVKSYFEIKYKQEDGGKWKFSHSVLREKVSEKKRYHGKYVIYTTLQVLSTEEILRTYINKSEIEGAFRVLKHGVDLRPFRHWKESRVRAHIFICILALFLKQVMGYRLKAGGEDKSADGILAELERIKVVRFKGRDVELEKRTIPG